MRRITAALCGVACAAAVWAALSLYPQMPAPPDGGSPTEPEGIQHKYGLEPSRSTSVQGITDALQGVDWSWSWKQS